MQTQTISKLYTDDSKSRHSSNPKYVLKSLKYFYETLYTKETNPKAATTKCLAKIPNREEILNEQFSLCEIKMSLDQIIKSIKTRAIESPRNNCLKLEFNKYFSHEIYFFPYRCL